MIINNRQLVSALLFISPALTLVVWGSYTFINFCLVIIGAWVLLTRRYLSLERSTRRDGELIALVLIVYVMIGIALNVYHHEAFKMYEQFIIFLLMPLAFWGIASAKPDQIYLWLGAAAGGVLSGLHSAYQVFVVHVDRAGGYMDNIQYGNLGVLLATASMVGILHWMKQGRQNRLTLMALIIGAIGGSCTSLFSGSKGGWLSLVIAFVFLYRLMRSHWPARLRRTVILASLIAVALVVVLPQSPVHKRLLHAQQDYLMWRDSGSVAGGSVGPRLELWRFGLSVAFERPLLGFGQEGLMKRKAEAVASGEFDKGIEGFAGLHNHFLHAYIADGIFALLQMAILLLIPLWMFAARLRQGNPYNEALATMGILLVLAHIEFGLSNALFVLNAVRQVFLFWLVGLLALMHPSDWASITAQKVPA